MDKNTKLVQEFSDLVKAQFDQKQPDLLVIGNGFDVGLGLLTSYNAFMDSDDFKSLLIPGDREIELRDSGYFAWRVKSLFHYLQEKRDQDANWSDIEAAFPEFSRDTDLENTEFDEQYRQLNSALANYIVNAELADLQLDSHTAKTFLNIWQQSERLLVVNFNYTSTVRSLIRHFRKTTTVSERIEDPKVIHIHGKAKDGNTVFGVEDSAEIEEQHAFLCKSVQSKKMLDFDTVNRWVSDLMKVCRRTVIYGHSLGTSDHSQFEGFFRDTDYVKKKLRVFTHERRGKTELSQQLYCLTRKQIGEFKRRCDFKMLDTSQEDPWA